MTETKTYPPLNAIPTHVGMIMDGNGRWAKSRGLPRLAGHRAGTENIREIVTASVDFGVQVISLYAFSTENWGRPEQEVSGLMGIFSEVFEKELAELHKQNVKVVHIGRKQGIPKNIPRQNRTWRTSHSKQHRPHPLPGLQLWRSRRNPQRHPKHRPTRHPAEEITDELISAHMFTQGIPDPDLIIRTSGEQRTSNFLVWQSVYAEWVFPKSIGPILTETNIIKPFKATQTATVALANFRRYVVKDRIGVILVLLPIGLAAIIFGGIWFMLLVGLLLTIAVFEFSRLFNKQGVRSALVWSLIATIAIVVFRHFFSFQYDQYLLPSSSSAP